MPKKLLHPDKPGWGTIDRYMPNATPEAQEEAYENLRSLAKLLIRIDDRLYDEEIEKLRMLQPPLF
jgi:hypothetical protein